MLDRLRQLCHVDLAFVAAMPVAINAWQLGWKCGQLVARCDMRVL